VAAQTDDLADRLPLGSGRSMGSQLGRYSRSRDFFVRSRRYRPSVTCRRCHGIALYRDTKTGHWRCVSCGGHAG
jgi:ribosomal protein L37AE/L43A